MIRIERNPADLPPTLISRETRRAYAQAAEFFNDRSRAARQRRHDFAWAPLEEKNVTASLRDAFGSRCAFCGCGDSPTEGLLVHHFRPPQGAVAADGETSRRHYWWLAYEWTNLYLACRACDKAKGAKFPVGEQRARVGTTQEGLDREEPLLLDPCKDDPEQVLVYLDSAEVASRDPRGRATIETFDLNRPDLIGQRAAVWGQTASELKAAGVALQRADHQMFVAELTHLFERSRPFAALRRQLANQWAQVRPRQIEAAFERAGSAAGDFARLVGDLDRVTNRLKQEVAAEFFGRPLPPLTVREAPREAVREARIEPAAARGTSRTSMDLRSGRREGAWLSLESAEIREVEIANFRAIDHLRLHLDADSGAGSWLMLLGENAAGKSSVLQAIALALADEEAIRALPVDHHSLLRTGAEEGFVRVSLTGSRRERELRFGAELDSFVLSGYPGKIVVAGYGSTRLLPRRSEGPMAVSGVEGLFDPFVPLARPGDWLPEVSAKEFDTIAMALKPLLNLREDDELRRVSDGIELLRGRRPLLLSHLSDGYQAMAGFGLDMMRVFIQHWGSIEAAEGIVLVDELGTHLHPRWQMKVTGSLRESFPRVQFIATTHDPLCLRGLKDGEVAVLRQSDDRTYALQDDLPPVAGLAVDQLLTSEHFGLGSTLDPKLETLLDRYYDLRAKHGLSPAERKELEGLSAEFAQQRLLGTTMRERLALEAADDFVAHGRRVKSAEEFYDLKAETRALIGRAWREARPG